MHINIQAANKTNILRIVYRMNNTTNAHKKQSHNNVCIKK